MPRKIQTAEDPVVERALTPLAHLLFEELRANREHGQPWIDERRFNNGLARVTVLWDRWDGIPEEERTTTIIDAYRCVEGSKFTKTITLATGLTFPEATASGMLPYQIITARRRDDPVSLDQLRRAMIEQGASVLFNSRIPQLRFATLADAEACLQRLIHDLPASEPIWQITRDVGQVLETSWSVDA